MIKKILNRMSKKIKINEKNLDALGEKMPKIKTNLTVLPYFLVGNLFEGEK